MKEKAPKKSEATRARIVDIAMKLFLDQGFEKTTMREIAAAAGMAPGAAYYHFRTKDEIVFAFYESTQDGSEERARQTNKETKDFAERIKDIIEFKLTQLDEYREFLGQLASHALVPKSPLSPFSEEAGDVRIRAIAIFQDAISDSDLKIAKELVSHLPRLLWLYQMAIILYWLHDSSINQVQTKKLIAVSQSIIMKSIALSRVPILRQLNRTLLSLLELFPNKAKEKKEYGNG